MGRWQRLNLDVARPDRNALEKARDRHWVRIKAPGKAMKRGYTENPPENTIFTPAVLRASAVAFSYTENSSFPYIRRRPCCD